MELMKILADPRRSRILHLASDKPVTVKYMAEKMDEEPLRLYYHVKKLIKAELLEVAETKQQGNLVEKYYKAVNFNDVIYKGNVEEQSQHIELALSLIHRKLDPGLLLYQKSLEKVREERQVGKNIKKLPYHVTINSGTERMTELEWQRSIDRIMKTMGKETEDKEAWPEVPYNTTDDEEGTYQYVLVTYKIEDAEQLGVVEQDNNEDNN